MLKIFSQGNAFDFNDCTLGDGKHLHLPKKNVF